MSDENCNNVKSLETKIELAVRFSETDAMGVVWHGNYLKFMEDAREEFGRQFKMEYLDVYGHGFFIPIVNSNINHKASVYYGQKVGITVKLEFRDAAKIIFHYDIYNLDTKELAAVGTTTQVFLHEKTRILELSKPEFYKEWENKQNWSE